MSQIDTHIEPEGSGQRFSTLELASDKTRLIKEIGKLSVQLYRSQCIDKSEEGSEFLQKEISILKCRLNYLRNQPGQK